MPVIDERLIDPTPEQLVRQLVKATRGANGRLRKRRIEKDEKFWQGFVRRSLKHAEGLKRYTGSRRSFGAAFVSAAWWTDHVGRRHWRIVGRRSQWDDDETAETPFWKSSLWQIYPDRVMIRQTDKPPEVVVICPCGVCGTPTAIGWTGQRCGPCHDRVEEGQPLPTGDCCPVLSRHRTWVAHLIFTADGRLVSGGHDGRIILWDIEEGTHRVLLHRPGGFVYHLAVSSTGMVAACTAMNKVMLCAMDADEEWRTIRLSGGYLNALRFSPDGTQLALLATRGAWLLDVGRADEDDALTQLSTDTMSQAVFLPDGQSLVLRDADQGIRRLDLLTGASTSLHDTHRLDDEAFELMLDYVAPGGPFACSPDGQWLATEGFFADKPGLYLYHLATGKWHLLSRETWDYGGLSMVEFTPDGLLVEINGEDEVKLWEPASRRLIGTLLSGTHHNGGRALSPDGELLAGTAEDGCSIRIWPWRQVLTSKG